MISNRLEVGINLTIKRSDGRVHPANVRGIDFANRIVEVEWSEGGEIKGKELFFDELLPFNSQITFGVHEESPQHMELDEEIQHTPLKIDFRRTGDLDLCYVKRKVNNSGAGDNLKSKYQLESISDMSLEPMDYFDPACGVDITIQEETRRELPMVSKLFDELKTEKDFIIEQSQVPETTQRTSENDMPQYSELQVKIEECHVEDPGSSGEPVCTQLKTTPKPPKRKSEAPWNSVKAKRQEPLKINRTNSKVQKSLDRKVNSSFINEISKQIIQYKEENPCVVSTNNEIISKRLSIFIRKRPLSQEEIKKEEIDVMSINNCTQLIVHEPKKKVNLAPFIENHTFSFDYIFDTDATNQTVFQATLKPLIESTLRGGQSAFLCFGQTGSGKSYTMGGKFLGRKQCHEDGLYALTANELFKGISGLYDLTVSVFEVYMTHLFDLLNNRNSLQVREDKSHHVHVIGLKAVQIKNYEEALTQIKLASKVRSTRQTTLNNNSSRSHCFLEYNLYNKGTRDLHGKCILIDLAGNERASDTQKDGQKSREEGAQINKSLLVLKECIRGMGRESVHLPFRGSKLTHILRPTILDKNNRISILGTVNPSFSSCNHSLDSLKYCSGFYSF